MNRGLRIALLISIGLHVFFMSAVTIINPAAREKIKTYTRVAFLGPLLEKTAFDIMLEAASPVMVTTYNMVPSAGAGYKERLKAAPPGRHAARTSFWKSSPDTETKIEVSIRDFFVDLKSVPDFLLTLSLNNDYYLYDRVPGWERKVVYKPAPPVVIEGLYGDTGAYKIVVVVTVGADGSVKRAEPLTTSGYPQLDIAASKFAEGWIFEPRSDAFAGDEQREIEILLHTVGS